MKILVIGGGGREHALVWKFRRCPSVEKVFCAPGNGGIQDDAECFPLDLKNVGAAADLGAKLGVDLTVVGPELPLVCGIANEFAHRGLKILAPTQQAAQLEGSKVFAKRFMERHGIPTASLYGIFDSPLDVYTELCAVDWPLVIKADGLCGGKGVLVTSSPDEATAFVDRIANPREFGDAGKHILLEEGLTGQELSYIILTDGHNFLPMAPTRDYKRAFDGNQGPNTGGMGAVSSDDILPRDLENRIIETVVRPTLRGLQSDGVPYRGFLYFGLMLTSDGPKVLEFNCRLGDPEAEVILARANFDIAAACRAAADGDVTGVTPNWSPASAVCVVIASAGYPGKPETNALISGIANTPDNTTEIVFHAGTTQQASNYYTSSGRVLMITATADSVAAARRLAYDTVKTISFKGAHYRTDIASETTQCAAG